MKKQSVWQLALVAVAAAVLVTTGILTKQSWYKIVSSVLSVIMLSFLVRGSRVAFPIGLIYYSVYAYICFSEGVYGAGALNLVCTIPIQIISFFTWKRRGEHNAVLYVKTMSAKWRALSVLATAAACVGAFFLLRAVGSVSPVLDAASTVTSVTALVLLPFGVVEQWFYNAAGNAFGLALWAGMLVGDMANLNTVLVFLLFTVNSVVGVFTWSKLYRKQRLTELERQKSGDA